jgi:hypothetical protein
MKKLFSLILCASLFLCLFGCNKTPSSHVVTKSEKVVMSLKEGTLTKEKVVLVIENKTDKIGDYGYPFILEKEQNGKWFVVNEQQAFILPAIMLEANSSTEHTAVFDPTLSKGKYRMIKNFYFDDGSVTTYLEFEIK